jgi:hypothetical protein
MPDTEIVLDAPIGDIIGTPIALGVPIVLDTPLIGPPGTTGVTVPPIGDTTTPPAVRMKLAVTAAGITPRIDET